MNDNEFDTRYIRVIKDGTQRVRNRSSREVVHSNKHRQPGQSKNRPPRRTQSQFVENAVTFLYNEIYTAESSRLRTLRFIWEGDQHGFEVYTRIFQRSLKTRWSIEIIRIEGRNAWEFKCG